MDICHPQRRQMIGADGGTEDIDDAFFAARDSALAPRSWVGTCSAPYVVRGRERMVRLVGEEPPFHHSVFYSRITRSPRLKCEVDDVSFHRRRNRGGARGSARRAGERDVLVAGGASTIRNTFERAHRRYASRDGARLARRRRTTVRGSRTQRCRLRMRRARLFAIRHSRPHSAIQVSRLRCPFQ